MVSHLHIQVATDRIAEFCSTWRITELALFGSVLRDDFGPDSDLDVLVTFAPEARWSVHDLTRMQDEAGSLFGRQVDLTERCAVEESGNYIRRRHILASAEPVYVAR